ncbi:14190_t:CDS:2 [Funneliformis mosseae]|uniref:14190_t:CDS:1 n=1 Tax=Funneliformis mosseae TaxID=27381 RepID=A0A9N9FUF1_FUNMO|nr:14190_t:CDS:2 [Funneliformis mosseae]
MNLQDLLLVALFSIFIIQVQATGHYNDYEDWEHDYPDNCEELFKTKNCNKCQKLMWDHFENPGQCATAFNVGKKILEAIKDSNESPKPYDLEYFEKGVTKYCHQDFHCEQREVEKIYKKIEKVCSKELSVKFDWSAHPKTYKDKTAYAAYGTLLVYYTGIPSRKAICLKNDNGDLCSIKFTKKFVKWMKKVTKSDPEAIVSHDYQFVIKGNGKKIRIPKSFQCDPCWRKMAKFFIEYIEKHKLKKSIEDNLWGSEHHHDDLPHCINKRGLAQVLNERSELNVNKRSAMPSFGVSRHSLTI